MKLLKVSMVVMFTVILLMSQSHIANAELFAPKKVDSSIVNAAKISYDKSVLSAKKIYDSQVQKSTKKFEERKEMMKIYWNSVYMFAKNDPKALLDAKKAHDKYVLIAKKIFDQQIASAKFTYDESLNRAQQVYSAELVKAKNR